MENKNKEIQSFDELKELASWFDPENYDFGTEPSVSSQKLLAAPHGR